MSSPIGFRENHPCLSYVMPQRPVFKNDEGNFIGETCVAKTMNVALTIIKEIARTFAFLTIIIPATAFVIDTVKNRNKDTVVENKKEVELIEVGKEKETEETACTFRLLNRLNPKCRGKLPEKLLNKIVTVFVRAIKTIMCCSIIIPVVAVVVDGTVLGFRKLQEYRKTNGGDNDSVNSTTEDSGEDSVGATSAGLEALNESVNKKILGDVQEGD